MFVCFAGHAQGHEAAHSVAASWVGGCTPARPAASSSSGPAHRRGLSGGPGLLLGLHPGFPEPGPGSSHLDLGGDRGPPLHPAGPAGGGWGPLPAAPQGLMPTSSSGDNSMEHAAACDPSSSSNSNSQAPQHHHPPQQAAAAAWTPGAGAGGSWSWGGQQQQQQHQSSGGAGATALSGSRLGPSSCHCHVAVVAAGPRVAACSMQPVAAELAGSRRYFC